MGWYKPLKGVVLVLNVGLADVNCVLLEVKEEQVNGGV